MRPLPAAVLTLLASTSAAFAADVPGNLSTTATIAVGAGMPNTTTLERPRDRDAFRVRLEAGEEYAASAGAPGDYRSVAVKVLDQAGKVVSKFATAAGYDYSGQASVRASYTGWYYILLADDPGTMPPDRVGEYYPAAARFGIGPDCGQTAATTCKLKPGVQQSRALVTPFDVDWFKVQLAAGRPYDVVGTFGCDCYVSVVDAKGKILSGGDPRYGSYQGVSGFKAPKAGTYYVRVLNAGADDDQRYTITLR